MNALVVLALSYAAMAAVSLSMERHQEQVYGKAFPAMPLRLGGWALLAVALVPAVAAWGTSVGILAWLGFLTFGALGIGLQMTYAPRPVRWTAPAGALLGAVAWLLA
ncbi:DUF3325 domain-containing protein [Pseudoduganella albidiflava]|uniref:DUF3325 domain-containing protein n=1 Tax=Pseudoduganella albidiflava TaxID=321983 RepID=A0A411X799_9BURK|nr:DUF3325 domain-containing protein [Pseudoduganella albidiflava]QBI04738.1 DUF3325 domain-containing protein [Pseudoduganella albidiflava]GGY44358.1 hypothetical protein GCM10007387_27840 [Pseudoduganella albidiflava]